MMMMMMMCTRMRLSSEPHFISWDRKAVLIWAQIITCCPMKRLFRVHFSNRSQCSCIKEGRQILSLAFLPKTIQVDTFNNVTQETVLSLEHISISEESVCYVFA